MGGRGSKAGGGGGGGPVEGPDTVASAFASLTAEGVTAGEAANLAARADGNTSPAARQRLTRDIFNRLRDNGTPVRRAAVLSDQIVRNLAG